MRKNNKNIRAALHVGLAGQPNTGKSTLFNRLTGGRQHVGNWPGKTVEKKSGEFTHENQTIRLVDLPGTYSLSANSAEELISRNHIVSDEMDALIVMVDASQLQRSMYLLTEIAGINTKVIVVCTMVDVATDQGKSIDTQKLQQRLGVPVVAINAAKGEGIESLKKVFAEADSRTGQIVDDLLKEKYQAVIGKPFEELVQQLPRQGIEKYSPGWLATRLIENDHEIIELVKNASDEKSFGKISAVLKGIKDGALSVANARYAWIEEMLRGVVSRDTAEHIFTIKGFDRLAIHWLWGKILAVIMISFGIAVSILLMSPFYIGLYYFILPKLATVINESLIALHTPLYIQSLITDALFPGISIIAMLFFFLITSIFVFGAMENVGYISRIAYVFDSWMERLGLHGKSILPFISGFLCNMIGVVGSRVIDSTAQRRTTIATSLVIPCMSCWGGILLVATIFFGIHAVWIVTTLLLATILHIAFTAWLFRDQSTSRKDAPGLIMELPPYHKPSWRAIFHFVIGRIRNIVPKTSTTILIAVLLIWALTYSGTGSITGGILYRFGKAVEPVSMLIGFDWRLLAAIIFSAFGKEAALGAIAILFGVGELGTSLGGTFLSPVAFDASALTHVIATTVSKASALAFIFAFYFNVPCFATVAIVHSETLSTRFTLQLAAYYFLVALLIAGVAYRIGLLLF